MPGALATQQARRAGAVDDGLLAGTAR
jgi:hypothetical protein